ncbi:hypothetical protein K2173_024831 [Erythroxylum novogranatense]|uniref:Uncharacterized protein n=1 Tax=Erythroxylum novogranatense TaxID=1862640 RepID=A0AAV8UHR7_9ROSI|nr:hypothetical protein K2173_024831 [Erythroxylum novogranatense]
MDVKLLDIRMAGSSSENVEISIKEAEALVSGIIISSTLRRVFRVKFLRRLYKKQSRELADLDVYPYAVHRTPERRKFSKGEWEKFTKYSTQKSVQELVLSPDFSQWATANAEKITVTPQSIGTSAKQQRKWFFWF